MYYVRGLENWAKMKTSQEVKNHLKRRKKREDIIVS